MQNHVQSMPASITLEEHCLFPELCDAVGSQDALSDSFSPDTHRKLLAIDQARVADLDASSISVQVISHIPFDAKASDVRISNDALHAAIRAQPSRFAGFALLPMRDAVEAALELEHAVNELGFVGALIPNHLENGSFYDTPPYDAVFSKAQELDVPLYLHPTYPTSQHAKTLYDGPWNDRLALNLGGWCWGWHSMVGLHVLRLYAGGVFERFPKLKIVIGHMGEMLPFMLDRIYPIAAHWPGAESRKRSLREVWDKNIWVTTSGMFSLAPMKCLLQTTRTERILYSVDYPLASNKQGAEFLRKLRDAGLVTKDQIHDIAYNNAARLLKLPVAS